MKKKKKTFKLYDLKVFFIFESCNWESGSLFIQKLTFSTILASFTILTRRQGWQWLQRRGDHNGAKIATSGDGKRVS